MFEKSFGKFYLAKKSFLNKILKVAQKCNNFTNHISKIQDFFGGNVVKVECKGDWLKEGRVYGREQRDSRKKRDYAAE